MQVLLMSMMAAVSLAVSTSNTPEPAANLEWSDHYAKAKVQAATDHRPLLVVLEDSGNPTGRFNPDLLTRDNTQVELLEHFQLCRMDVSTDYGKRVAAAFGAKEFPFTAITDKSAQYITFQAGGAMSPEQWKATLTSRKEGNLMPTELSPGRVETSKIITSWPIDEIYSVPSNCPNCVKRQYYR